ncbi:hypothetical protein SLEP1_g22258 [Rubroshorea leprosula]|uniref:Uncharacterized protein n=1 Tax=Rubroshorea leprosula TaxID=152421 RepID=A0AAV5JEP2_9ROSI|nr:hypothetical protein SLEP1_g22258 [Rubroshorea leprosula]
MPSFSNFIVNFNKSNMEKSLPKFLAMIHQAKRDLRKGKSSQVLMIRHPTGFVMESNPKLTYLQIWNVKLLSRAHPRISLHQEEQVHFHRDSGSKVDLEEVKDAPVFQRCTRVGTRASSMRVCDMRTNLEMSDHVESDRNSIVIRNDPNDDFSLNL